MNGKTAATLSALTPRHLPALVIAPKRVAEHVWPTETALWRPDLRIAVAAGSPADRKAVLADAGPDLVALGRDNAKDALKGRQFRTLIIDELSGYKSGGPRGSMRWKVANRLVRDPQMQHVWGLTGTPAPNGYMDLWGQIALLDNGTRLGKNITTYRSRYFRPGRQIANGTIVSWDLREGAQEKIDAAIEDICLSMSTQGRIALPPVTYNTVDIELPAPARTAYRKIARDLLVDLREIFGTGGVHTAGNAAVLTSKLSQIAAGFLYEDDSRDYAVLHQEKVSAVRDIVEEAQGSPVLVFYRFRAEAEMLRKGLGSGVHHIDDRGVIDAWNRGEVPVLLAHPASAGHGLNLQHGGHTAVWTSLDWDLELWQQANKRLIRQGQQHPVVIHMLLAARSVDYLIRTRLTDKADVQDSLLAYLESPI